MSNRKISFSDDIKESGSVNLSSKRKESHSSAQARPNPPRQARASKVSISTLHPELEHPQPSAGTAEGLMYSPSVADAEEAFAANVRNPSAMNFDKDLDAVLAAFAHVDENDNGTLSYDEFANFCGILNIEPDIRSFRRADRDSSGVLGLVETLKVVFPAASNATIRSVLTRRRKTLQRDREFERVVRITQEVRDIFNRVDTSEKGYVCLEDLRHVMHIKPNTHEDDVLQDMVVDNSSELLELRRIDRLQRHVFDLAYVLRHVHVHDGVTAALSERGVTIRRLPKVWCETQPLISHVLRLGEAARIGQVVEMLRRGGVLAVTRTIWSPVLEDPPQPPTLLLEATTNPNGTPRNFPPVSKLRLQLPHFARFIESRHADMEQMDKEVRARRDGKLEILPFYYEYEQLVESEKEAGRGIPAKLVPPDVQEFLLRTQNTITSEQEARKAPIHLKDVPTPSKESVLKARVGTGLTAADKRMITRKKPPVERRQIPGAKAQERKAREKAEAEQKFRDEQRALYLARERQIKKVPCQYVSLDTDAEEFFRRGLPISLLKHPAALRGNSKCEETFADITTFSGTGAMTFLTEVQRSPSTASSSHGLPSTIGGNNSQTLGVPTPAAAELLLQQQQQDKKRLRLSIVANEQNQSFKQGSEDIGEAMACLDLTTLCQREEDLKKRQTTSKLVELLLRYGPEWRDPFKANSREGESIDERDPGSRRAAVKTVSGTEWSARCEEQRRWHVLKTSTEETTVLTDDIGYAYEVNHVAEDQPALMPATSPFAYTASGGSHSPLSATPSFVRVQTAELDTKDTVSVVTHAPPNAPPPRSRRPVSATTAAAVRRATAMKSRVYNTVPTIPQQRNVALCPTDSKGKQRRHWVMALLERGDLSPHPPAPNTARPASLACTAPQPSRPQSARVNTAPSPLSSRSVGGNSTPTRSDSVGMRVTSFVIPSPRLEKGVKPPLNTE